MATCTCFENGDWFAAGVSRRIGEGDATLFWDEDWFGVGKLRDRFTALHAVSVQQGLNLKNMGMWIDNKWTWDLRWARDLEGFLLVQRDELLQLISSFTPMRGRRDSWTWIKENDGKFSVKSAYDMIVGSNSEMEEEVFKILWRVPAPSNAILVGWKLLINRIQSKENLDKRNVHLADLLCPLCSSATESADHLFFNCLRAWQVWSLCANWLGIWLVFTNTSKDHFTQFVSCLGSSFRSGLSLIWLAIVWHIWTGRNGVVFREEEFDAVIVFDLARKKAWEWLRAKNSQFCHALSEWYMEPVVCLGDM